MILKTLKIFSQNVCKNRLLTDTILENNKDFDILFIQESLWSIICTILSSISEEEEEVVKASNHPSWIMFTRYSHSNNEHPRVLTYINIILIKLHFSLQKDILNHEDINLILFFNHGIMCFIINVYSDDQQSTLKHLKNTKVNSNNVLIMIGGFNIKDNDWNPLYLYHSTYVVLYQKTLFPKNM